MNNFKYIKLGVLITTLSLAGSLFNACNDDIELPVPNTDKYEDYGVYGYVKNAGGARELSTIEVFSDKAAKTQVYFQLTEAATQNTEVQFKIDSKILDTYNSVNGTSYEMYPQENVTFTNNGKTTIEAGERTSEKVEVELVAGSTSSKITYALPISVELKNGNTVLEQKYQNYIYLIRPKGQIPDISKGLVKNFCYIEVKSDNILNAGEYTMKESGKPFFDVVHIFAAKLNFQPSGSEAGRVFLECGDDIKYIFQNADKLIRPLQEKGIKVCLSMFGSNGVGLANLSKETAISVAKEIKYYVETYGLDGVDFDDEWADYKKHNLQNTYKGFDAPSGDNYARLIYECRRLMPDKLITVYEFGTPPLNGTTRVTGDIVVENQKVVDMIDYTYYGSYGSYATNRENTVKVPREMYGPCPVNLNFIVNDGGQKNENYFTSTSFLETNLGKVVSNGYGAMVFYNLLPSIDYSFGLNEVGKKLYGEEVVWSGKTYDKTSAEPKVVERINYDSYIGTWKIKPLESLYWFAEGNYWQFGGAEEFTIRIEPKEKGHTYNVYGWGDVKELIEDYPFEMQYNSQTGRLEVAGGQELYNENGKTYTLYGRYQSFGSNIATIKKTDTFLKSTLLRFNTNFTIYGLNGTSIIADKKLMIVPLCSDSNEDNNNLKSGDKHPVGPFSFTKVSDLY